jgi:hypothetical protein
MQQWRRGLSPDEWHRALRTSSARQTPDQEAKFIRLVDLVSGQVTPEIAKSLLSTFRSNPDFGTQERVCSVLAGAPTDARVTAVLEELPRLIHVAPVWADVLMGGLIDNELGAVKRHLHFASAETRLAVRGLVSSKDFSNSHPNAGSLNAYCT